MVDKRKERLPMVENIIDQFDFEKCQKIMTLMEWSWYGEEMAPSLSEMRAMATRLLDTVWYSAHSNMDGKRQYCECGRFVAVCKINKGIPYLELYFKVESIDSENWNKY